jgi:chorismate mutase/prephenate dehydratase
VNTKLDELRHHIDSLDIQIVSLLNQRASTALQIGTAKQGQPIHQPAREMQVLQNVQSANQAR